MQPIRGIIFDLDETLYSISHLKMWMALNQLGDLKILLRLTEARASLRGKIFEDANALKAAMFEKLGDLSGVGAKRAATWYEERFFNGFIKVLEKHAIARPKFRDLISLLKQRGVKLAVISDYGRVLDRLKAIGLNTNDFDYLAAVEDFGTLKPSAIPFLAVSSDWKLRPDEVIVVGDREDLDEQSAREAGMYFLGIRRSFSGKINRLGYLDWSKASKELDEITMLAKKSRLG